MLLEACYSSCLLWQSSQLCEARRTALESGTTNWTRAVARASPEGLSTRAASSDCGPPPLQPHLHAELKRRSVAEAREVERKVEVGAWSVTMCHHVSLAAHSPSWCPSWCTSAVNLLPSAESCSRKEVLKRSKAMQVLCKIVRGA